MKTLLSYVKQYKPYAFFACFFMIADCVCELIQPLVVAKIVDEGINGNGGKGDIGSVIDYGLIMICLSVLGFILAVISVRCASKAGVGFAANLRDGMFRKVQTYSFKNIDGFSVASLTTRMTNDLTIIQNTSIMCMRMLMKAPVMFSCSFVAAILIKPTLSTVLIVTIPLLIIGLVVILKISSPRFAKMQKSVDDLNSDVQTSVRNVRVVKSFVRQDFEREKFKKFNDNAMNASLNAMNVVILNGPLMTLLMNGTIVAVFAIGGRLVTIGDMRIGDLTAYVNYINHILMSLMVLSMVFMNLTRAAASVKRIREVLETEPNLKDPETPAASEVKKGRIEFKNVSFKYDEAGQENILSNINFTANPGEVVAIVGGTGSGKTSMVQLIPRLYDISEGNIYVDGVDVRDYNMKDLRNSIGMVLQNNTLFSGTIRENLCWGNKEATEEEIQKAAKAASAHDFIMSFPEGYDTYIEQGGVNVSGGQKQRLCIARAMLKKPSILILDDSTSAVDTATEAKIRESFYEDFKNTTVLIIAQRISSVMSADRILVLDNGKIVDQGTHQELMEKSAEYRDIYYSQMEKEED